MCFSALQDRLQHRLQAVGYAQKSQICGVRAVDGTLVKIGASQQLAAIEEMQPLLAANAALLNPLLLSARPLLTLSYCARIPGLAAGGNA
mgnify:CR=1 FL=1